jgi:uncharacterized OsmC-like protein
MASDTHRFVSITRAEESVYVATNARGGTLTFGSSGTDLFSPVELFLAALAGCTAVDVDVATGRKAEPEQFDLVVEGHKIRDADGARMTDLRMTFTVTFPDGPEGDAARQILPRALKVSHDKECTVSRTVELGTPVRAVLAEN